MSVHRRLVLTFDAFGTLFTPRDTIGAQYALVARKYGLSGFTSDQLNHTFRDAFRKARHQHPNYGKATGMIASQWWSNVIRETFGPIKQTSAIPDGLVLDLLQRFSTSAGYSLSPGVLPFFLDLRRRRRSTTSVPTQQTEIVVGIISNSDDRIYSILQSFGLSVSSRRWSPNMEQSITTELAMNEFDFITLSYDVGFAKPNRQIFDAAKACAARPDGETGVEHLYIHVGDDPVEDFHAAEQAGWRGMCIGAHEPNTDRWSEQGQIRFFSDFNSFGTYLWNDVLSWEAGGNERKC